MARNAPKKPRASAPAQRAAEAKKKKAPAPRRSEPAPKRRRKQVDDVEEEEESEESDEEGGTAAGGSQESEDLSRYAESMDHDFRAAAEKKAVDSLRRVYADARGEMEKVGRAHGPESRKKTINETMKAVDLAGVSIDSQAMQHKSKQRLLGFTDVGGIGAVIDLFVEKGHLPLLSGVDPAIAYYGRRKEAVGAEVARLVQEQGQMHQEAQDAIEAAVDARKFIKAVRRTLRGAGNA